MSNREQLATQRSPQTGTAPRRGVLHAWQHFVTHYFDFTGRSTRPEFWWWLLTFTVVSLVLALINKAYVAPVTSADATGILNYSMQVSVLQLIWTALNFIGAVSLTVRRLHDTGRPGWWWFIQLIPLAGAIIMIALVAFPTATNRPISRRR